jgi:hypothetical protein
VLFSYIYYSCITAFEPPIACSKLCWPASSITTRFRPANNNSTTCLTRKRPCPPMTYKRLRLSLHTHTHVEKPSTFINVLIRKSGQLARQRAFRAGYLGVVPSLLYLFSSCFIFLSLSLLSCWATSYKRSIFELVIENKRRRIPDIIITKVNASRHVNFYVTTSSRKGSKFIFFFLFWLLAISSLLVHLFSSLSYQLLPRTLSRMH